MSENLNYDFDAIDQDAILDIKISGRYIADLRVAFAYFLMKKTARTKAETSSILKNVAEGKISSEEEHALAVIFHMLKLLQVHAIDQGHVVKKKVDDVIDPEFRETPHSENDQSE